MAKKRAPSKEKSIEEINPQEDIRVSVIGEIKDMDENNFKIKDESGEIDINTEYFDEETLKNLGNGGFVRIIGRVFEAEGNFNIQGEIIQDFSNFDINLYNKVNKILKENR